MNRPITRRALISAALTLVSADALGRRRDRDRGIGGTGGPSARVEPTGGDRGIGGTGVIGTIRRFGSIVVNDMRIGYNALTRVQIDGREATQAELRIGQVVQTLATADGAGFATARIVITSEVVGPIEAVTQGGLVVLGQRVATGFVDARSLRKGEWIAVSGLRDLNGVIHASYIQRRDESLAQVAGPVRLRNGVARIGGLALTNLDPALEGRRVLARIGRLDGKPAIVSVTPDPERAALPDVRHFSIETYVARSGGELRMGSGLTAAAASPSWPSAQTRAVIALTVNADGGMTATAERPAPAPEMTPADSTPQQSGASSGKPAHHDARDHKHKGDRHKGHDKGAEAGDAAPRVDDGMSRQPDSAAPSPGHRVTPDASDARSAPAGISGAASDPWTGRNTAPAAPTQQPHFDRNFDSFHNGGGGHHRR
jgi:hypothetical protein